MATQVCRLSDHVAGVTEDPPSRCFAPRMGSLAADGKCALIAGKQHGLILRDQALEAGLSDSSIGRRVRAGLWRRRHQGLFVVGAAEDTFEQSVMAACLVAGPDAIGSHRTAARLHALEGFDSDHVDVLTSRRFTRKGVAYRCGVVAARDRRRIGGIPVTGVERTLEDLGAVLSRARVEDALESALRMRLTTIDRLHARLSSPRPGQRGIATLRPLLELRRPPTASSFELEMERLLRRYGFPEPVRQKPYLCHDGIVRRPDLAYPGIGLVIECQSYRWHGGRRTWSRDLHRMNEFVGLGLRVLQFTMEDVRRRPRRTAQRIAGHMPPEMLRGTPFAKGP